MTRKLTEAQRKVLSACADGGRTKSQFHSKYWRNFDQLERRGLLAVEHSFSKWSWHPTPAGRRAIAQEVERG